MTTVILFSGTDLAREVVKVATTQEYFPEWVTTAYSLLDVNILARTVDQEQWAHAFGIGGQLPPVVKTSPEPNFGIFGWYWGQHQGTITSPAPGLHVVPLHRDPDGGAATDRRDVPRRDVRDAEDRWRGAGDG